MKKTTRVVAAAMLAASGLLATSCGERQEQEREAPAVSVEEIEASLSHEYDSHSYSGTVEEKNGTPLSFPNGGTISQILVNMGDAVRKGQLVAMTDTTQASDAVEMARATLRQAEDTYSRMKQLHDAGSLPDIKWVETESKVDQARIQEKMARKHLADCSLRSPIDGVVSQRNAEAGQVVAPSAPVVTIVTAHDLEVSISVPESEVRNISVGQHAQIGIEAAGAGKVRGVVSERGVKADPLSRSYTVRLRIEGTTDGILPGMVATVAMERAGGESAIVLPAEAVLLADDNSNFVWVDEGGTAKRKRVTCTGFAADGVVIGSGLSEGDKVIVRGQHKICTGTKVTTVK